MHPQQHQSWPLNFPEPMMERIFAANEVAKHLKMFPVKLKIHAIPEQNLRLLLVADSAFDTSGKEKSQHGWLLGFTDQSGFIDSVEVKEIETQSIFLITLRGYFGECGNWVTGTIGCVFSEYLRIPFQSQGSHMPTAD